MEATILVAEKNSYMRETVIGLLENQPGMKIAGATGTRPEMERLFKELAPDLAIVDVHMLGFDPAEVFGRMSSEAPDTGIIAFSNHTGRRFVDEILKTGVSGYLLKDRALEELLSAVLEVHRKKVYVSPRLRGSVPPGIGHIF